MAMLSKTWRHIESLPTPRRWEMVHNYEHRHRDRDGNLPIFGMQAPRKHWQLMPWPDWTNYCKWVHGFRKMMGFDGDAK